MHIAAIDMGGTRTKIGLLENGRLVAAALCDARPADPVGNHLEDVAVGLTGLCRTAGLNLTDCAGVGLLHTGVVDGVSSRVVFTNGKYDDAASFDFAGWAAERLGLPLRMENDARGALLGEWFCGAARGARNVVMITVGTGIGTAVIMNRQVLVGPHHIAGLLGGHLPVHAGGARCRCGATGCIEAEAGGWALAERACEIPGYEQSLLAREPVWGFKQLFSSAWRNDSVATALRRRCLQYWGDLTVSLIQMYDPEVIVLGGGVMNDPEEVLPSLQKAVESMVWTNPDRIKLTTAAFPDYAGLYGAAALFETIYAENGAVMVRNESE